MSCAQKERVVDSLYGELSDVARAEFDAHVATCDSCRKELEVFGRARALVRPMLDQAAPASAMQRLRAEIQKQPSKTRWWSLPWLLPALSTAGLALLLLVMRTTLLKPHPLVRMESSPEPLQVSVPVVPAAKPEAPKVAQTAPPERQRQPTTVGDIEGADKLDNFADGKRGKKEKAQHWADPPKSPASFADMDSRTKKIAQSVPLEFPHTTGAELSKHALDVDELKELGLSEGLKADRAPVTTPAPAMAQPPLPSENQLVEKASRAFADGKWQEARALYRELLLRFPAHRSAPMWKQRIAQADVQLRSPPTLADEPTGGGGAGGWARPAKKARTVDAEKNQLQNVPSKK